MSSVSQIKEVFENKAVKELLLESVWNHQFSDDAREKIQFQENLIVARFTGDEKTPTPVGALCINVQYSLENQDKLVVYVSSKLCVDGEEGGTKITSWVDTRQLHTLEEKRVEYLEGCDRQSLYVAVQKDHLHVSHSRSTACPDNDVRSYPLEVAQRLVCEGANLVLMRQLANLRCVGQLETTTLYINGDVCRNVYECLGPEAAIVNGEKIDVVKIYRQVIESCGIVHVCHSMLTLTGRIVNQEWKDCDYVIHANPLMEISSEPSFGNRYKVNWREDLQLFSTYLDRKQLCLSKVQSYVKDRPDIQYMLADYVQNVLLMKPADVIEFTREYFSRYSHS